MRHLLTIFILTFAVNCFGQFRFDSTKISGETGRIVSKIEKGNKLMGSAVYYEGTRPPQYDNFTELQNRATEDELAELTNHPNGVVRCYAFWALTYKSTANLLPIVISHIGDTSSVKTLFGCIASREKVGDFFISLVTPQYVDLDAKKLTVAEYDYLDSLLVYTPNNLYAKETAISRIKQNEASYERVRELVVKENNQSALVTLAKFRKKQDIPLIINNRLESERYDQLFFTYKAICEFPDDAFLPLLKKALYEAVGEEAWSTEWRELYKAIASFKSDTAVQLLKVPFTQTKHENIREYHINFIFEAVQESYTPIYDELFWTMWENDKKINSNVFNILYPRNRERAFDLTKQTIQNADDFYYLNTESYSEDDRDPVSLLSVMLDIVLVKDRPFAIAQINKNIREINVHQFPIFAEKALEIKDTSFVTSLFDRLEHEDNPHIYLKAAEVLIAFNKEEINKRIIEVSKRNPSLRKDWGGEAFSKLLKDNGME